MSTSQKFRNFIEEPMGDKPVDSLAGIGEVLGNRLKDQGFQKVFYCLLIFQFVVCFFVVFFFLPFSGINNTSTPQKK